MSVLTESADAVLSLLNRFALSVAIESFVFDERACECVLSSSPLLIGTKLKSKLAVEIR